MKHLYLLIIAFLAFTQLSFSQSAVCEDPDPITVDTDCGTHFDLCVDRYSMEPGERGMELKVFTNDMGMFDVCESDICSPCNHGQLTRLANCNFYYEPDEGFSGYDTFFYEMVINESCVTDVYCEDGKIWTIYSRYTGPDGRSLRVYSKNGNDWDFVDEAHDLSWGDYFLIDGSHLPPSQANWRYQFYSNDMPEGEEFLVDPRTLDTLINVHTSCSQLILGEDFGYFRTISGCIATQKDKDKCAGNYGTEITENGRFQTVITTQTIDTTMVVIYVEQLLPIDIRNFVVSAEEYGNEISWFVENVVDEDFMILEKSEDGIKYEHINRFADIKIGQYAFTDQRYSESLYVYYRITTVNKNGQRKHSDTRMVMNKRSGFINIYPNPTNNELNIELRGTNAYLKQISIYDATGKLLISTPIYSEQNVNIDLSNSLTESGYYLIDVTLDNGLEESRKVLFTKSYY